MNPYNIIPQIRITMYRITHKEWHLLERTIGDHELVLVTKGKGSFTVEGQSYEAKSGMLYYFYPGLSHFATTNSQNPMCFYAIHFNFAHVDYAKELWEVTASSEEILPLKPVQAIKNFILIKDLFKKINTLWNEKGPGYELISKALFQQALYQIIRDIQSVDFNYSVHLQIDKIINQMHKHLDKKYTLIELSNYCGLSPSYLSKVFKGITGYTPIEYSNKMKIDQAKEWLIESPMKVNEVAASLGFADEFYFSRVFKKIEGLSPTDYRRQKID